MAFMSAALASAPMAAVWDQSGLCDTRCKGPPGGEGVAAMVEGRLGFRVWGRGMAQGEGERGGVERRRGDRG